MAYFNYVLTEQQNDLCTLRSNFHVFTKYNEIEKKNGNGKPVLNNSNSTTKYKYTLKAEARKKQ